MISLASFFQPQPDSLRPLLSVHFHIPTMSNTLQLLCIVDGRPLTESFYINIQDSHTVNSLREQIKNANASTFGVVDANKLDLWKVDVPVKNLRSVQLSSIRDDEKENIMPWTGLKSLFTSIPQETLHVIVQCDSGTNLIC